MDSRIRLPAEETPETAAEDARLLEAAQAELERAKENGTVVSLMRVEVEAIHLIERVYGALVARAILRSVAEVVAHVDRTRAPIGLPVDGGLLTVWPKTGLADALEIAETLIACAKELKPTVGGRKVPIALSIGVAHSGHEQDYSFATLDRVAREGAAVASAGGGDRAVHTELYTLLQPKAGRVAERKPAAERRPLDGPRGERSLAGFGGAPSVKDVEPIGGPFAEVDAKERELVQRIRVPRSVPAPPAEENEPSPHLSAQAALGATTSQDEARDLSRRLERIFLQPRAAGATPSPRQMQEAVIETVLAWRREQEIARQASVKSEREQEVEQLKRRLAKISQSLLETEAEVARLSHAEADERGVASAFKQVQGLSPSDPMVEAKKLMMAKLLEANLELLRNFG